MGKLQKIKDENPELFQKNINSENNGAVVQNIPLKLEEYEDKYFVGINLETKERIKIYLRDIEQKNISKQKKRKEIDDFQNQNDNKLYAEPGVSTLLFEGCYPDNKEPGVYSARWCNRISRNPQETRVMIVNCSLVFFKRKNEDGDEENILVRTIHPEKMKEVGNLETLEEDMSTMLSPVTPGSNPFVYIRITDDEGDVEIIPVQPKRVEREDGLGKTPAEGGESVEMFLNSEKSELVKIFIEDPEVKIELIPARVIFPGTATKENMLDAHPNAKKILKEAFYIKANKSNEDEQDKEDSSGEKSKNTYPELGFLKCCLAIRSHADGTPYFTHVRPIRPFEAATSVKDI